MLGGARLGMLRQGKAFSKDARVNKHRLVDLELNFELYPRESVDDSYVERLSIALENGAKFPPIVIDEATKEVVDGFHRYRAYLSANGGSYKVECIEKRYRNNAEKFEDAIRFNVSHGRRLMAVDLSICTKRGLELGMTEDAISRVLFVPRQDIVRLRPSGKPAEAMTVNVPSIATRQQHKRHAVEDKPREERGISRKGASRRVAEQLLHVNQVIQMIEEDSVASDHVVSRLRHLSDLLYEKYQ